MNQKCPYCGNELEEGSLRSRGGNYFLPAEERVPILFTKKAMKNKKAIILTPDFLSVSTADWPQAYTCRDCKKIIIPYE